MRKSELIAKLHAIEGDPLIFLDLDGEITDEIGPHLYNVNPQFLQHMTPKVTTLPDVGDKVILI